MTYHILLALGAVFCLRVNFMLFKKMHDINDDGEWVWRIRSYDGQEAVELGWMLSGGAFAGCVYGLFV